MGLSLGCAGPIPLGDTGCRTLLKASVFRHVVVIGDEEVQMAAATGWHDFEMPACDAVVLEPACFYSGRVLADLLDTAWTAVMPGGALFIYGWSWPTRREIIQAFLAGKHGCLFTVACQDGLAVVVKPRNLEAVDIAAVLWGMNAYGSAAAPPWSNSYAQYGLSAIVRPRKILEVGVLRGFSGAALVLGSGVAEVYVGVDNGAEGDVLHDTRETFLRSGCPLIPAIVIGDSSTAEIPVADVDLLHLDAGHDIDSVFKDLVRYWPYVRAGGVVWVDDWLQMSVRNGIHRFMSEEYRGPCFILETETGGYGIVKTQAANV